MDTLINGAPCDTISVNDRGFLYGDGVFRTIQVRDGKVLQWNRHYAKLVKDCSVLNILCPAEERLRDGFTPLIQEGVDAVLKVIITRGTSQRGYAPPLLASVTCVFSLSPCPVYPESFFTSGVRMHLCRLRLGHQPYLAGVKHLNRLENVLAAAEWNDPDIAEGLLLDESDYVIEGVRSNIFMVKQGALITPDLSRCGVSGVQRERILEWAAQHGMAAHVTNVTLDELLNADEVFLVNSVIGLWPVREIAGCHWYDYPVARTLQNWLTHDSN